MFCNVFLIGYPSLHALHPFEGFVFQDTFVLSIPLYKPTKPPGGVAPMQQRMETAATSWHFVNEEATLRWGVNGRSETLWSILSPTLLLGYVEHGSIMPAQYVKVLDMASVRVFGETGIKIDVIDAAAKKTRVISLKCPDRDAKERWYLSLNTAVRGANRDRRDGGTLKRTVDETSPSDLLVNRVLNELDEHNHLRPGGSPHGATPTTAAPSPMTQRTGSSPLDDVLRAKQQLSRHGGTAFPYESVSQGSEMHTETTEMEGKKKEEEEEEQRRAEAEAAAAAAAAAAAELEARRIAEEQRLADLRLETERIEEDRKRLLAEREEAMVKREEERRRDASLDIERKAQRETDDSARRQLYQEELRTAGQRRDLETKLQNEASQRRKRFEDELSDQKQMLRKHEEELARKRHQAERDDLRWEERRKEEEEWLRAQHRRRAEQRDVLERQKQLDAEEEKKWEAERLADRRRREQLREEKDLEDKEWKSELEDETRRMEERRRFEESVRRKAERQRMVDDLKQRQEDADAEQEKERLRREEEETARRIASEDGRRTAAEEAARRASNMSDHLQLALDKAESLKRSRACLRESLQDNASLQHFPSTSSATPLVSSAAPHPYLLSVPTQDDRPQDSLASSVPRSVQLCAPHPFEIVSGAYKLRAEKVNSWPCWESAGRGFIYATKHGYWAVVDEEADMCNDAGLLQSSVPHYGRPPTSLPWDSACDGKWKKDVRVVLEVLGDHPNSQPEFKQRPSPPAPDLPGRVSPLPQGVPLLPHLGVVVDDPPLVLHTLVPKEPPARYVEGLHNLTQSPAPPEVGGGVLREEERRPPSPKRTASPRMLFVTETGRAECDAPIATAHTFPVPPEEPLIAITPYEGPPPPVQHPPPRQSLPRNDTAPAVSLQAAAQRQMFEAMQAQLPPLEEMPPPSVASIPRHDTQFFSAAASQGNYTESVPSFRPSPARQDAVWEQLRQSRAVSPQYPTLSAQIRTRTPPTIPSDMDVPAVPGVPLPVGASPAFKARPPQNSRSYSPMEVGGNVRGGGGGGGSVLTPVETPVETPKASSRGFTSVATNRQRWEAARQSLLEGTGVRRHSVSSGAILERYGTRCCVGCIFLVHPGTAGHVPKVHCSREGFVFQLYFLFQSRLSTFFDWCPKQAA